MRLCVVTDFFVPHYQGGGERRYYELLKRLASKGHTIDLICMKIKCVEAFEYIDGINVYHIGPTIKSPPKRGFFDFMRFISSAMWWLSRHDYDIIEANTWIPLIPASIMGKLKRVKTVAVVHDLSSGDPDQWLTGSIFAGLMEKLLVRLPFDGHICVSKAIKERLISQARIKENKITVFPDGVDLALIDSVKAAKKEKDTIIFVGRLIPHKHVDDLILAVQILKRAIPGIRLKVVGGGQESESLKSLASRLKLEKHVSFLGIIPEYKDMIKEIKRSQLLVLPSTREGFGIVLIEAFASNIPCVAYSSDGVVDVIDDGINGYLV
jgi:glycosyltransferase involved in cell wall biosynthesis